MMVGGKEGGGHGTVGGEKWWCSQTVCVCSREKKCYVRRGGNKDMRGKGLIGLGFCSCDDTVIFIVCNEGGRLIVLLFWMRQGGYLM